MSTSSRFRLPMGKLVLVFCGIVAFAVGCEPEMPVPPPRESTNPAEDDFVWAMERMEHAIERFQPASSLGLSVKRSLDYELIPPSDRKPNYTARVTITMKTVYRPLAPSTTRDRKQAAAEREREANKLKLDNPYVVPGEDPLGGGDLSTRDIPPVELPSPDVPDPRLPAQKIEEKEDYLLEYVDSEWKLQSTELEEHERMWFDYALQQGEFAPDAGVQ